MKDRVPWWLWPNLIALDAPTVGIVWQRFFGLVFRVSIPVAATVTLALVILAVYLTDRWLDADPRKPHESGDRHRFARKYRTILGFTAGTVWIAAASLAWLFVPKAYLVVGAGVAVSVACYFAAVHRLRKARLFASGGKEGLVGILFAAGVSVPLIVGANERVMEWLPAVGSFAAVCWLNCEWIARWENHTGSNPSWRCWFAMAISLALALFSPIEISLAITAAVLSLVLLHLFHRRLGVRLARVLADLALMTPLVSFVL